MHENRIQAARTLSLGFVISSVIFVLGLYYTRSGGVRSVAVKGLAEREVDANVGIWPIRFETSANDLNQLNGQIKKQTDDLVHFLKEQGIKDEEIVYGCPYVEDRSKYRDADKGIRYSVEMFLTVHSSNVFLLYKMAQKSQEIMQRGVLLSGSRWDRDLKFIFTDLNAIKPSMIQEATINAKKAAQQFATDSDVRLGVLRKAAQGSFSIEETHLPTKKKIRVVTQMEYAIQ